MVSIDVRPISWGGKWCPKAEDINTLQQIINCFLLEQVEFQGLGFFILSVLSCLYIKFYPHFKSFL